jgi:drug/metabolite transporter (DMT)-like permease
VRRDAARPGDPPGEPGRARVSRHERAAPAAPAVSRAGAVVMPLLFLLLYLIWGFTYVAIKIGLRWTGPLTMAGARAVLAGLALAGLALALGRAVPREWRVHRLTATVGLLNVAGLAGLMSLGLTTVSAGETSLLIYTQPLQVAALSALVLAERLSRRQLAGLLLGFGGMTIVLAPRIQPSAAPVWWAYAVLLTGAGCWALATVLYRGWQRAGAPLARVDVLWVTALQALYGAVPLLVAAWLVEGLAVVWTGELVGSLLFTGLLSSGLANVLWFYLLTRRAATVVSTYVFLVPAFAVGFGALVLGEPLTPSLLAGGLLTLTGIALVSRQ